jgi:hypothetical protein
LWGLTVYFFFPFDIICHLFLLQNPDLTIT